MSSDTRKLREHFFGKPVRTVEISNRFLRVKNPEELQKLIDQVNKELEELKEDD